MATYHAISATSAAILKLLETACPKPEFDGAQFELYQAKNFQNPMEEGVALYLYRIGSGSRRNLPSRVGPNGEHYRPPILVDLYYLLSVWGKTAAKQQMLLGWCIRELADTPVLPAGLLNHFAPESGVFRAEESVELVFEPLPLQDLSNVFEPFKPNLQAAATYVGRMVMIDSDVVIGESRVVQTRGFDYGKVTNG